MIKEKIKQFRNQDAQIIIMMTKEEKSNFIQVSKDLGFSSYRDLFIELLKGVDNFKYLNLYREVINEINDIGVNYNQMTKYVNTYKVANDDYVKNSLEEINNKLEEILRKLKNDFSE